MSEQREIVEKCLHRIAAKYARRGKPELWTDDTCEEFLRAFAMIPVSLLPSVVDEVLLNPPTDDKGRVLNWLPDPADIVTVARKLSTEGGVTPSDIVAEALTKIRRFGQYGVRDAGRNSYSAGAPSLSPGAQKVVAAMGGWSALCTMEAPDGVVNGMLTKHAQNVVEAEQNRLILAIPAPRTEPTPALVTRAIDLIGRSLENGANHA